MLRGDVDGGASCAGGAHSMPNASANRDGVRGVLTPVDLLA